MSLTRVLTVACLTVLACAGCKSVSSESSALSAVVIHGNTPGQINRAIENVFAQHDYKVVRSGPTFRVMEKKGSTTANIAYGNWMGTSITIRVRTRLIQVGEAVYRLECLASRVRDAGGTVEEEIGIGRLDRGPFEKMLKEVEASLTAPRPSFDEQ